MTIKWLIHMRNIFKKKTESILYNDFIFSIHRYWFKKSTLEVYKNKTLLKRGTYKNDKNIELEIERFKKGHYEDYENYKDIYK